MHIYSLSIFRAIAIVLVVYSHTDILGALTPDTLPEMVIWNILSGATTLFVFISGFLFDHVFLKKFKFGPFFAKKFINLFVPYIPATFIALALGCAYLPVQYFQGDFRELTISAYMLATGHASLAYWYIPFAITLFAMAPLHVKFAALNVRWQLAIVGVMLVIALLIHRPFLNLGPIHNLIYYTPVYFIGMMCSQHRNAVYPLVERFLWPLLGAVIGLATLSALLGHAGNYGNTLFTFAGIDLMLAQKLCLCLFMMGFLRRCENQRSPAIDFLSEASFGIFFLHPIIMQLLLYSPLAAPFAGQESWYRYALLSTLCLLICAAIAWAGRRMLGQQSRLVTGY